MQNFSKEERLCSKKLFDELLKNKSSLSIQPFKVLWSIIKKNPSSDARQGDEPFFSSECPVKLGISVSKRNLKRAVDRNRIKRLIRESYRKNKNPLYDFFKQKNENCVLLFIYLSKKEISYLEVENKINLVIQRLIEEIKKKSN